MNPDDIFHYYGVPYDSTFQSFKLIYVGSLQCNSRIICPGFKDIWFQARHLMKPCAQIDLTPKVFEMRLIPITDWAHNAHSVPFEQS